MALTTYADLQAAIASWKNNRTDLPAADLIVLAEARLNRDLRLRTMEVDAALTAAVGSRRVALPAGFLEPLALFLELDDGGRAELRFVAAELDTHGAAGRPARWTVDGGDLAFERPADQAYGLTLRMLQRFGLSDLAPTNALLTSDPDIYLAAANIEAALYLMDDEQAVRWQARYADALASINARDARSRALTTLSVDPALGRRGAVAAG